MGLFRRKAVNSVSPERRHLTNSSDNELDDSDPMNGAGLWRFDPTPPTREDRGGTNWHRRTSESVLLGASLDEEQIVDGRRDRQAIQEIFGERPGLLSRLTYQVESSWLAICGGCHRLLLREIELGSGFNFLPAALACGIMLYYGAVREPFWWAMSAALVGMLVFTLRVRERGVTRAVSIAFLFVMTGMAAAQFEVVRSNTTVPLSAVTGQLSGTVIARDVNSRGSPRYLIALSSVEGLPADGLPKLVRVSAASFHETIKPGEAIEGLARLQPVSGPAYPGGYDFQFFYRLEGIGLSGFFMGAPRRHSDHGVIDFSERFTIISNRVRLAVAERIRAVLPGRSGDIAIALLTGDRSHIDEDAQESLRRSGLAHILAISGLHMALVTLTIIWGVRLGFVLFHGTSDRLAAKKWAATIGFFAATAYLFISGASVATQRAWLMIAVMIAAVLLDRQALTMRSVAIAALVILLWKPSSLFNPGFQMSFAAVAALIAAYRQWTEWRLRRIHDANRAPRFVLLRSTGRYFGGLAMTSLIAGTATALFALYHFHRVAPLGLAANLAAMPVVSLLAMPLLLLSALLMPFGFEWLALMPLGASIEVVIGISDWINAFEMDFETGVQPVSVIAGSGLFLAIACGLRTRLRLLSIGAVGLILAGLFSRPDYPDMLVSQDGKSVLVRAPSFSGSERPDDEQYVLLYPRRGKFIADIWRRAYLPNEAFDAPPANADCNYDFCQFTANGHVVSLVYAPEMIEAACEAADLLVAPRLWWINCRKRKPAMVVKRGDFERFGSLAVRFSDDGFRLEHAMPGIGSSVDEIRPWRRKFDNSGPALQDRRDSHVPDMMKDHHAASKKG